MNLLPRDYLNSVVITLLQSLHNYNLFNQANLGLIGVYKFVKQTDLYKDLKFQNLFETDTGSKIELELFDKLLEYIIQIRPNELFRITFSELSNLKKNLLEYIEKQFVIDSTNDDIDELQIEINKELFKLAKETIEVWFDTSNKVKEFINLDNLDNFTNEYIQQVKTIAFEWYKAKNQPDSFKRFLEQLERAKIQAEKKTLLIRTDTDAMLEIFKEVAGEVDNAARYVYPLNDYKILESRRVFVAAAPPGFGKSQLLRHITAEHLKNASVENPERDRNVIFYFSFENTRAETFAGILANITDVPINEIFTVWKNINEYPEQIEKLQNLFKSRVQAYNVLSIIEYPTKDRPTVDYIKSEIEKQLEYLAKEGYNPNLYAVVVDYLGLISPSNYVSSAYERLGEALKELKALAMQMNTAVFTAAQINRQGTAQLKKKGVIEQEAISDSWRILQEADVLVGLALKKITDDNDSNNSSLGFDRTGNLTILKHRYFREGIIPVNADYSRSKFFKASDELTLPVSLFDKNSSNDNDYVDSVANNDNKPDIASILEDDSDEVDFDFEID